MSVLSKLRLQIAVYRHLHTNGGMFAYEGLRLAVPDTVDLRIRHSLVQGDYERPEMALIDRHLSRDRPVIELGGCLGVVSAKLRSRLDSRMPLYVVEANEALLETIRQNARRPDPGAITEVVWGAVHYGGPSVRFQAPRKNVHISRVAAESSDGVDVPAVRLADLVAKLPEASRYSLVCDIEGAEFDLFENDASSLQRCEGAIIETHPQRFTACGRSLAEFEALTRRVGFTIAERDSDVIALVRSA